MVFPIVGGTQSTGYDISNSLKFNDDDSSLLSRAYSTDPSDQKLTTISFWFKIGNITDGFRSLYRFNDGSATGAVYLRSGNDLQLAWDLSSSSMDVRPNGVFRDPTAWYHFHAKVDTTQGTAANRVIIHINGVERTYGTATYPNQNATLQHLTSGKTYYIGGDGQSSDKYFDGYITEFNIIDGQAKEYTDFGEFNDNGVWIPKKYTGTYGNNGFYLQFKQTGTSQNSSGIGADTSGNDLHWAVANLAAADVTEDTCTNNFCTLNPLHKSTSNVLLSEGNLKAVLNQTSGWQHAAGTIAVKSGKFYWEAKALNVSATDKTSIGVLQFNTTDVDFIGNTNTDRSSKGISGHGAGTGSYSYAEGDIIQCAMDLDNNKIYWGKNGTYFGTLNPANGSGSTTQTIDNANFCVPVVGGYADSSWEMNFGVPQFSISSGNSDGEYGDFEYAPPSGFYALCTKRIGEFG